MAAVALLSCCSALQAQEFRILAPLQWFLQSNEVTRDMVDEMGDAVLKYKGEKHKASTCIFPSLFPTLEE